MLPWGHAALAYLSYAGFVRWQCGSPPAGFAPVALVVAALLPDVVDKPLAWTFSLLPTGRALFHSLVFLLPLAAAVWWVTRRYDRPEIGDAVTIGLFSHALGDALQTVFTDPFYGTPGFLVWPLLPGPVDPNGGFHYLWESTYDPFFFFQTGLTVLAAVVWYRHGLPGLPWLRDAVRRN